jgi:hypothetical protein
MPPKEPTYKCRDCGLINMYDERKECQGYCPACWAKRCSRCGTPHSPGKVDTRLPSGAKYFCADCWPIKEAEMKELARQNETLS